jgi:hypothetical protein
MGVPRPVRGRAPADIRRVAIEALAIGAVLGGVWWRWWAVQNAVPDVVIPAPRPAPAVNGFDVVARAFVPYTTPGYRGLGVADAETISDAVDPWPGHVVPEVGQEAAVRANAALIAAVHASLALPWQMPPPNTYVGLRSTARLLCLAGNLRAAHGDPGGAARIWLDGMEVGADKVEHDGIGNMIESIDRMPLWAAVNSLGRADARATALRVEQINDRRPLLAAELADEKASTGTDLLARMRSQSLPQFEGQVDPARSSGYTPRSERSPMTRLVVEEQLLMKSKSAVLHDYLAYMDAAIARASLPYAPDRPALNCPADPINLSILPSVDDQVCEQAARRTQDSLLSAALALRAYRVEHGTYPASLAPLVAGGYLTHAPVDYFDASGATLRYQTLAGDRYLLYSVGQDGVDNGGRPVDNDNIRPNEIPSGDVVAGVTLY